MGARVSPLGEFWLSPVLVILAIIYLLVGSFIKWAHEFVLWKSFESLSRKKTYSNGTPLSCKDDMTICCIAWVIYRYQWHFLPVYTSDAFILNWSRLHPGKGAPIPNDSGLRPQTCCFFLWNGRIIYGSGCFEHMSILSNIIYCWGMIT